MIRMTAFRSKRSAHTILVTVVSGVALVVALAGGAPSNVANTQQVTAPTPASTQLLFVPSPSPALAELHQQDVAFLDEVARDTWAYLSSDWATDNHLPWSWRSASTTLTGGDYDNPAEIGLYALSWLGAYEMQKPWSPNWLQTEAEVTAVLDQLRAWQTGSQNSQPHGPNAYNKSVFYQWYWINWNPPVVGSSPGDHVVPSVDNAWLAASLITIREYGEANGHLLLAQKANAILADMNFMLWYHAGAHRFSWGATENPQGGGDADYYSNENRIINFVTRALGQISAAEFRLSLAALVQNSASYDGIEVKKVAWDGSLFTYIAPALFIREMNTSYGATTITPAVRAQITDARNQGYPVWGLSDCFDIGTGGYIQQGAPPAASPNPIEAHPGVVTPHASALALITPLASDAITNLHTLSNTFAAVYHPNYGFRESVMVKPGDSQYGVPSDRFSALAQEWLFLSLVNAETGFIWTYFYRDGGVQQAHREMYPQAYLPLIVKAHL